MNTPAVDIFADIFPTVYVKGMNNNTYRILESDGSTVNLGSVVKPWDSPHSLTDLGNRLWEFQVAPREVYDGSAYKTTNVAQYKCGVPNPPTCDYVGCYTDDLFALCRLD